MVLDTGLALEPEREAARAAHGGTAPPEAWRARRTSRSPVSRPTGSERARLQAAVRLRPRLPRRRRAGAPGGPRRGRPAVVCARGAQQRLGLGPAALHRPGPRRLADRARASWPRATGRCSSSCPTPPRRTSSPSAIRCYRDPDGPLLRTRAGEELLARLRRHAGPARRRRVHFGASRLAVRVGHPAPASGCVYCGHCLDGCPYGHIYSAAADDRGAEPRRAIEYRPGLHVERVSDGPDGVIVQATALAGRRRGDDAARRARVPRRRGDLDARSSCSARGCCRRAARSRTARRCTCPSPGWARSGAPAASPATRSRRRRSCSRTPPVRQSRPHLALHLQRRHDRARPRAHTPGSRAARPGARRHHPPPGGRDLLLPQRRLRPRSRAAGTSDSDRVRLDPVPEPGQAAGGRGAFSARCCARSARSGSSRWRRSPRRPRPAAATTTAARPRCARSPPSGETDTLGRPSGARRIHVVDATCFPSVPGGAITLTAMANAHRIASGGGARASRR